MSKLRGRNLSKWSPQRIADNASAVFRAVCIALVVCTFASAALAQSGDEDAAPGALAIRQEGLTKEVQELQQKMARLIQELEDVDDEQADRLAGALRTAQEAMLGQRMEGISELLNRIELDRAVSEQDEVIVDLLAVLQSLTEKDEFEELQERIRQLEEWRNQVNQLSREEWQEKRDSEKMADLDKAREQVANQIARLSALKERQEALLGETAATTEAGSQNMEELAREQEGLRKDTEGLAKDMAEAAGQESAASAQSESGAESSPEGQSGKPSEPSQSAGQQQGSPGQSQAGQSSESSSAAAASATPPSMSPEPGQQPLAEAAAEQASSRDNLEQGRPASSQENQKAALDAMERALAELQREQERLAEMSEDDMTEMSEAQDETEQRTGELASEMAASPGSQSGGQGQPGEGQPSPSQAAAQESLQNAQQSMQQASSELNDQNPDEASEDQQEAFEQLQEARESIDEELEELREEQRDALLAKLIGMFRQMLEEQVRITQATADLQAAREDEDEDWDRTEELACARLAAEEKELDAVAGEALTLMIENSSPVVFPEVVKDISGDLQLVAGMLADEKTGASTHAIQKDIEAALEDLVEALEMAQSDPPPPSEPPPPGGQPGESPRPPLVSPLAELKLLRNRQVRINQRTTDLAKAAAESETPAAVQPQIDALTRRQETVAEMTDELIRQVTGGATPAAAPEEQGEGRE